MESIPLPSTKGHVPDRVEGLIHLTELVSFDDGLDLWLTLYLAPNPRLVRVDLSSGRTKVVPGFRFHARAGLPAGPGKAWIVGSHALHLVDREIGKILLIARKGLAPWGWSLNGLGEQLVVSHRGAAAVPILSASTGAVLRRQRSGEIDFLQPGWAASFAWGRAYPIDAALKKMGPEVGIPTGQYPLLLGDTTYVVGATSNCTVTTRPYPEGAPVTSNVPQAMRTKSTGQVFAIRLPEAPCRRVQAPWHRANSRDGRPWPTGRHDAGEPRLAGHTHAPGCAGASRGRRRDLACGPRRQAGGGHGHPPL